MFPGCKNNSLSEPTAALRALGQETMLYRNHWCVLWKEQGDVLITTYHTAYLLFLIVCNFIDVSQTDILFILMHHSALPCSVVHHNMQHKNAV